MLGKGEKVALHFYEAKFFVSATVSQINELAPQLSLKSARYGQFFPLNRSGQKRLMGVDRGVFKVVNINNNGEEIFKCIAFKGDLVGGPITSGANDFAHVISKEATFFSVNCSDINNWLAHHDTLKKEYNERIEIQVNAMQEWFTNMMRMNVKERLLYFLDILAEREGIHVANHTVVEKRFTQDELASLLFTSRQSIVRCLHDLSLEGKVNFSRGSIQINDRVRPIVI